MAAGFPARPKAGFDRPGFDRRAPAPFLPAVLDGRKPRVARQRTRPMRPSGACVRGSGGCGSFFSLSVVWAGLFFLMAQLIIIVIILCPKQGEGYIADKDRRGGFPRPGGPEGNGRALVAPAVQFSRVVRAMCVDTASGASGIRGRGHTFSKEGSL